MRILLLTQAGLTIALALLLTLSLGAVAGFSGLLGGLTSLVNLALLVTVWPRLLEKKQVALSVATIVFKFALLGWILYLAVHSRDLHLGWFALGLALVLPSVVVAGFSRENLPISSSEKVEN